MTIYKFPLEFRRAREQKREKKAPLHYPEFIDIEDLQNEESIVEEEGMEEAYASIESLEKVQLPLLVRLFALGVAIALFLASALLFVLAVCAALASLLTLRMVPALNDRIQCYRRYGSRLFATALGLLIACVSPALGMGFIGLYFALQGETADGNFLHRFFRQPG